MSCLLVSKCVRLILGEFYPLLLLLHFYFILRFCYVVEKCRSNRIRFAISLFDTQPNALLLFTLLCLESIQSEKNNRNKHKSNSKSGQQQQRKIFYIFPFIFYMYTAHCFHILLSHSRFFYIYTHTPFSRSNK